MSAGLADADVVARPARSLADAMKAGEMTATEVTQTYLARIDEVEPQIRAFAHLDRDGALRQARDADARRAAGAQLGLLHGLPVAVKDIIDTIDLPTEFGTPLHRGRRPRADALIVRRLRVAGAIVLGKTVTSEYALYTPGLTRNPLNRARSPGGSSSGSAAAIAAGMAPLAVATQTNGSTIRPASFCGIVGYKPSLGMLPRAGILRQSALLDQPGVMAADVGDAALLAEALAWHDPDDEASAAAAPRRLVDAALRGGSSPRLAYVRGPYWQRADADARQALDAFVEALAGIVTPIALPPAFDRAADVHRTIMEADIGKAFHADYERGRDQMSDVVRGIIERGLASSAVAYAEAVAMRRQLMADFVRTIGSFDALVTLAATGSAPLASAGTGDPIMSTAWTLIGAPAISLPLLRGADGMPIGVQLVAGPGDDERLLPAAAWLEARHRSRAEMVA